MVLNQGKSHYMCLGRNTENEIYVLKKKKMKNSEEQKTFKSHVMNLCKKDLQEIWALVRLSGYLIDKQKCLIFNSVIRSQFNYYLIVYIFCSRQTDNTIT